MDQKKTLWIIAAVGAFLLVVLGAAVIIYSPSKKSSYTAKAPVEQKAAPAPLPETNNGWATPAPSLPPQQPVEIPQNVPSTAKVGDMIVLADNATVYGKATSETNTDSTTIDLNALKKDLGYEAQTPVQNVPQNINITVNIPEPVKEAPRYEPPRESAPVKVVEKTVEKVSAPKAAATSTKPVTKTVTKASATTPAKTTASAPAKTSAPKAVTQYWVQVAAYSNKKGAENARSILDSNKIPSDIFTYQDSKNTLFYRVRVGPYTTKSEAEYWRTRIIKISEFSKAESFVTSTTN